MNLRIQKKNTKICLVNPPTSLPDDPGGLPTGLLAIGTVLKQEYPQTWIYDLDPPFRAGSFSYDKKDIGNLLKYVLDREPDFLGMTAYCSNLPFVLYFARKLREANSEIKIILGGPQVSPTAAEVVSKYKEIDVVVRGESEQIILPLMDQLVKGESLNVVPGITYLEDGKIIQTSPPGLIEDLDDLSITNYSLINVDDYFAMKNNIKIGVEAGRGCPYNCIFCSTSIMWQRKYRMKTPKRLFEDMKLAANTFGVDYITLVHDNFTTSKNFIREFCGYLLEQGTPFTWGCSSRSDQLDSELVSLMAKAGCKDIFFGIESGSWKIQQQIGKRIRIPVTQETLKRVTAEDIDCTASFIIGHLDENLKDLNESLELMVCLKEHGVTNVQCHILAPHNGTEVFYKVQKELFLDPHSSHLAPVECYGKLPEIQRMILDQPTLFPSFFQFNREHLNLGMLHFVQNIGFMMINYFYRTLKAAACLSRVSILEVLLKIYEGFGKEAPFDSMIQKCLSYLLSTLPVPEQYNREYLVDLFKFEYELYSICTGKYKSQEKFPPIFAGQIYEWVAPIKTIQCGFDVFEPLVNTRKKNLYILLKIEGNDVEIFQIEKGLYKLIQSIQGRASEQMDTWKAQKRQICLLLRHDIIRESSIH